jgi:hypothetical protein
MSSLSSHGRSLVDAGRRAYRVAYRPTDESRARLTHALSAQLDAPTSPPSTSTTAASVTSHGLTWPLVSAILVGVGIVGGAIFFLRDKAKPLEAQQVPMAPPALVASPSPEPATAPAAESSEIATTQPSMAQPSGQRRGVRLTDEVELLSRATRALHAGHDEDALKALDEYRRRFPKGYLHDEESAARAQVLCALGRFDEAKAKIANLPSQSALSARARQFCDSRSK